MARILFVDDEPSVLDGLRRSLRRQRSVWEMSFAVGGKEALSKLKEQAFDIVVSEIRMAGIDGFELLEYVKSHFPDAVRIVFSAQTELDIALRSIPIAHQVLPKPCSSEVIREVISRAVALRGLFVDTRIREVVSSIGTLPSQPRVYMELTRALRSNKTSASQIAEIIARDLAMSAKVLHIVNSAFFGLPRQIAVIQEAVTYLGVNLLMSLALAVHAFKPFSGEGAVSSAWLVAEQEHGLLCGTLARQIIEDPRHVEHAFLAGMLHDIGKLVLASKLPKEFRLVRRLSLERGVTQREVEKELFGVSHAEIGAYLIGTWGVPFSVTEAVAYHHRPLEVSVQDSTILASVHLADALLYEAAIGIDGDRFLSEASQAFAQRLGVANKIERWRDLARQEIERVTVPKQMKRRYALTRVNQRTQEAKDHVRDDTKRR